jgi:hypothetical protein
MVNSQPVALVYATTSRAIKVEEVSSDDEFWPASFKVPWNKRKRSLPPKAQAKRVKSSTPSPVEVSSSGPEPNFAAPSAHDISSVCNSGTLPSSQSSDALDPSPLVESTGQFVEIPPG